MNYAKRVSPQGSAERCADRSASLGASAETENARRGRGKLQRSAEAKKGFQRDCAQGIVPKRMDEQKRHRNHPRAGLSPFNGVFADKGAYVDTPSQAMKPSKSSRDPAPPSKSVSSPSLWARLTKSGTRSAARS